MQLILHKILFLLREGPGTINSHNAKVLMKYYGAEENSKKQCQYCKMPSIPRAKHCRLCDVCVEKQDHHCIWINGCVGARNYKYFLWFLIGHAVMCIDISTITFFVMLAIVKEKDLLNQMFIHQKSGKIVKADFWILIKYFMGVYPDLCFVLILTLAMGVALTFFFCYHLLLVARNQTTYEMNKVSDRLSRIEAAISRFQEELRRLEQEPDPKKIDLIKDKIQEANKDLEQAKKYPYNHGFCKNMQEVLNPCPIPDST